MMSLKKKNSYFLNGRSPLASLEQEEENTDETNESV
jgi:hypothetical protein